MTNSIAGYRIISNLNSILTNLNFPDKEIYKILAVAYARIPKGEVYENKHNTEYPSPAKGGVRRDKLEKDALDYNENYDIKILNKLENFHKDTLDYNEKYEYGVRKDKLEIFHEDALDYNENYDVKVFNKSK